MSTWLVVLAAVAGAASAVSISSLSANGTTIGRYDRYEVTFNMTGVSPSNYNPFRPETTSDSLSPAGIDVWADVVTPSGKSQKVWGFYDVDYDYLGNSKKFKERDRFVPASAPHWMVRYAPMEVGMYRMTVNVKDSSGTASSQQLTFNCTESGSKGFIKVAADGSRFTYSDGSPFVPFGSMMPYGTDQVASYIPKMKANGMNFVRRWLVNRDQDDIYRNLEGWTNYSTDISTFHSGARSAIYNVTGANTIADQSFIGCKPNTYYKAFAYIKTSSSFNGTAAVYVVEDRSDSSTSNKTGNTVGSGKDWTYSEVIFKTAANAELLHFKPKVVSGSSGTVWIDDVGLYECDSTGKVTVNYNMVFNPSFEPWTPAQLRMIPLARVEYLLKTAEANGVAVQPCMFDYRLWNPSNPTGFYSSYFGDWWTDSANIAQQRRDIRYLVARFGAFRSVFAWELANEMDSSYTTVRDNWISNHANYIKQNDPNGHMITNSYWNSPADYQYSQISALDLSQVHYYINTEEPSFSASAREARAKWGNGARRQAGTSGALPTISAITGAVWRGTASNRTDWRSTQDQGIGMTPICW